MPSCELCGRSMKGRGRNVVIEGASMLLCPECGMKFGHSSSESAQQTSSQPRRRTSWTEPPERQTTPRTHQSSQVSKPRSSPKPRKSTGVRLDDMELIEDYAKIIRSARQKKSISQDELAQRVGESISTLKSIESGRQKPTEKTIRGLERELEISLLEPLGTVPIKVGKTQHGTAGPTLGDRVIVKKKMSQKARRDDDVES
ncbi:MAG: multiprotein bridging factor aMBF1 [Candidatus Thorarchaeota archaeon]